MYTPIIRALDNASTALYESFPDESKQAALIAGKVQRRLNESSPYKTKRRFFDAQWCWALGHIGLLYQAIRWFHVKAPGTELVLETRAVEANKYFLEALRPYIYITPMLSLEQSEEAVYNAVYFACPDGIHHIHDWVKIAERECQGVNLLKLSCADERAVDEILDFLGLGRPYVAVQARAIEYDAKRNVSLTMVEQAIEKYRAQGFDVVSTGLDDHPINDKVSNILRLAEPKLASFLLSAACDQFIGSDSGAWTIPWAYGRPVKLMNDDHKAWIYP